MITFEDAFRGWLAIRYPDQAFSPAVIVLIAELKDAVERKDSLNAERFVKRLLQISGYLDTWGERVNATVVAAKAVHEVGLLPEAESLLRQSAVLCANDRPRLAMVHFLLGVVLYDQEEYEYASQAWNTSRQTLSLLAKSHSEFTPKSGWYLEIMQAIPRLVAQNLVVFDDVLPERAENPEWPFNFDGGDKPGTLFYEKAQSNLPG